MSKEIEEMAKIMCQDAGTKNCNITCNAKPICDVHFYAERLYKEGYRKQSEWISVEDRLPDENVRVLVCIKSKRSYTKFDTDRLKDGKWVRWYMDVTHWMPLPDPPKMRKEDEGK